LASFNIQLKSLLNSQLKILDIKGREKEMRGERERERERETDRQTEKKFSILLDDRMTKFDEFVAII
jgi:hypothetical protein